MIQYRGIRWGAMHRVLACLFLGVGLGTGLNVAAQGPEAQDARGDKPQVEIFASDVVGKNPEKAAEEATAYVLGIIPEGAEVYVHSSTDLITDDVDSNTPRPTSSFQSCKSLAGECLSRVKNSASTFKSYWKENDLTFKWGIRILRISRNSGIAYFVYSHLVGLSDLYAGYFGLSMAVASSVTAITSLPLINFIVEGSFFPDEAKSNQINQRGMERLLYSKRFIAVALRFFLVELVFINFIDLVSYSFEYYDPSFKLAKLLIEEGSSVVAAYLATAGQLVIDKSIGDFKDFYKKLGWSKQKIDRWMLVLDSEGSGLAVSVAVLTVAGYEEFALGLTGLMFGYAGGISYMSGGLKKVQAYVRSFGNGGPRTPISLRNRIMNFIGRRACSEILEDAEALPGRMRARAQAVLEYIGDLAHHSGMHLIK